MAKTKVFELAREQNITVKTLLDMMKRIGINAKSHMSALDEETVGKLKQITFPILYFCRKEVNLMKQRAPQL